jgi:hypothetical protein
VVKGTDLNITLNVKNAGYASPYNKRTAKVAIAQYQNRRGKSLLDMATMCANGTPALIKVRRV